MKNFPESKLPKLAHSIKISNENKLRELVTALVTKATAELRAQVEYHWPEGLTEKGIKILEAGAADLSSLLLKMISIIIDDPMLTENFDLPPNDVDFPKLCAVIPLANTNGHDYNLNQIHINSGTPSTFFRFYAPEKIGNSMTTRRDQLQIPTDDEIKHYIDTIPSYDLTTFIPFLSEQQINDIL